MRSPRLSRAACDHVPGWSAFLASTLRPASAVTRLPSYPPQARPPSQAGRTSPVSRRRSASRKRPRRTSRPPRSQTRCLSELSRGGRVSCGGTKSGRASAALRRMSRPTCALLESLTPMTHSLNTTPGFDSSAEGWFRPCSSRQQDGCTSRPPAGSKRVSHFAIGDGCFTPGQELVEPLAFPGH